MIKRALVIVGKAPRAGQAKTRLSPPLSLEQAALLYRGFLQDTASLALRLHWERVTMIYPPQRGARAELRAILPDGVSLQRQPGNGLGAALSGAFSGHIAAGFQRVVLIGSDNPSLPPDLLESACRGLDHHDLVIGPSADGGYYLIGMHRPHLGLFERITWSTEVVYQQTLERAREAKLSVLPLREWYDVDTVADLRRLQRDLALMPLNVASTTRHVLTSLRQHLGHTTCVTQD